MRKPYFILIALLVGCSQPVTSPVEDTVINTNHPSNITDSMGIKTKAKFDLFGMSSEGSEVLAGINVGKLESLSIKSYGAMGTTTMTYDKQASILESVTTFFPKTGLPPKKVIYNISVDENGGIKIFDGSDSEERFLECALSKVTQHVESNEVPYPELHIDCP